MCIRDRTDNVIDQLWAEAKARWQAGESLYLSGDVEQEAKIKQEEHREVSVREGMIEEFVEKQVPVDWAKWPLDVYKRQCLNLSSCILSHLFLGIKIPPAESR